MYWKSTDCSERYLSQLPGGRVANFILEQRRSSHSTSPSVKRSTKTKFVEKIPEKDVDILDLDPYQQTAYLEPTNPVNVLKVRIQRGIQISMCRFTFRVNFDIFCLHCKFNNEFEEFRSLS